ncbi:MAG: hypothetical protein ACBR12_22660 [Microcoleus sp.]
MRDRTGFTTNLFLTQQTRPGNTYAVKAIENTKMAIAQAKVK